jgi:shikimate kinase
MGFPTRIFLTGFMGSGKSTLGPIVANVLGYAFCDLDEEIAARAGMSVQRVFAEQGEAAFRAQEAAVLRDVAGRERIVVAVGGGALASEGNLQWALRHGTVVYLHVPAEQLLRRLLRGRSTRPLLLDGEGRVLPEAALQHRVGELLARREPYYRRAHVVVEVGNRRVGPTVDEIIRALRAQHDGR